MFADLEDIEPVRHLLPDVLLRIERVPALVDIAEVHGRADVDVASVGLLLPRYHLEQGGLAGAVGTDDPDDAAGGKAEAQILEQQFVAKGLGEPLHLDDLAAEPLRHLDENLA